jgi:putative NADH-flavin reductase
MKIALLGASGRIDQCITLEALVRHPESFPIAHPHLTVAHVDIFDPGSVAAAITDSDVVMYAMGLGRSDPHPFYIYSTKAVIEGMKRAGGNKRLIVVGGAGSLGVAPGVQLVDTPTFPKVARPTSLSQCESLDILRASDIAWTFFSPSEHIVPSRVQLVKIFLVHLHGRHNEGSGLMRHFDCLVIDEVGMLQAMHASANRLFAALGGTGMHRARRVFMSQFNTEALVTALALVGLVIMIAALLSGVIERKGFQPYADSPVFVRVVWL